MKKKIMYRLHRIDKEKVKEIFEDIVLLLFFIGLCAVACICVAAFYSLGMWGDINAIWKNW